MMGADAIAWLLASRDASVRYLTLTQVIGESPRSRQVRASREGISTGPRVSALLAGQRRDGGFGVHPYRKWTGAFWRLVSLVELAIPPGHPQAVAAAEQVLAWLCEPAAPSHDPRGGRPGPPARHPGGLRAGGLLPAGDGPRRAGRDACGLPAGFAMAGRGLGLRPAAGRCPLDVPREHRAAVGAGRVRAGHRQPGRR